ncbi:NAD kinase [Aurantimonas sp. C2-5-R2]|uniref:NAD kinase n=1 Tax=unclassified Aurantimonas TaxID=2638230 RepID=UPI002E17CFAD|nr:MULTISPECIES: NAD kinase [unclassified Aurantimonas]MEC5293350.1 NAD kinase [Aurantimonas sp. C2-3-R2]MEC5414433.1 NAD kinase [Aurantimonas sp. C2-4-R8]
MNILYLADESASHRPGWISAAEFTAADAADVEFIVLRTGNSGVVRGLHRWAGLQIPIFPMSDGSSDFLTNGFREGDIEPVLRASRPAVIRPLHMRCTLGSGAVHEVFAYNEVTLARQSMQMSGIEIWVNGKLRLPELIGDGVLVATPAGSTAYNFSVHGPILPLDSGLMALTPIAPYRPRRWRGAMLPETDVITCKTSSESRMLAATADFAEYSDVVEITVRGDTSREAVLLFEQGADLSQRQLAEQFAI